MGNKIDDSNGKGNLNTETNHSTIDQQLPKAQNFQNELSKIKVFIEITFFSHKYNEYEFEFLLQNSYIDKPFLLSRFSESASSNSKYTFRNKVNFTYLFENIQILTMIVKAKSQSFILKKHFIISELISFKHQTLEIPCEEISLRPNSENATNIKIQLFECERNKQQCEIKIKCSSKLLFNYLYFTLHKYDPNHSGSSITKHSSWVVVYKSEEVNCVKPIYEFAELSIEEACLTNGDQRSLVKFTIYERVSKTYSKPIVTIEDKFSSLFIHKESPLTKTFNENKSNEIVVEISSLLYTKHSFIDYLSRGMQISLSIGIDFSASNQELHNVNDDKMNQYQTIIKSCGEILSYYDNDQLYPVYGFGAKVFDSQIADDCFPVNLRKNPYIYGISNVLMEYNKCFKYITPYGPTRFSPLIRKVLLDIKKEMELSSSYNEYSVLIILSDGNIDDMEDTINIVIECSQYPISLIIIGVGKGNFDKMICLDADESPLTDKNGKQMKRDIVQFVPFVRYRSNIDDLIKEILKEIPSQIVEYYYLAERNNK